jgi:glycerate 2-kinase
VCPDKFRGSLNASVAAAAIARGLRRGGLASIVEMPLADGGEGTLDALLAGLGGSLRTEMVTGPSGDRVAAQWAMLQRGGAVIEMARASGHALIVGERDALHATTRGTGELIDAAIRAGCTNIIVGVGGSATTDGGLPALDALRWSLRGAAVTVACDVSVRFVEAAAQFGPQKGATPAQVSLLTRRMRALVATYRERTGVDVSVIDGSGAAGGLAGGLAAIGARLEPGFDVVANALGFDELLAAGCDLLVTGEGKLDASSLQGKVVGGALDAAAEYGIKRRVVICGVAEPDVRAELVAQGVAVFALADRAWDIDDAFARAELLCEEAALECARE